VGTFIVKTNNVSAKANTLSLNDSIRDDTPVCGFSPGNLTLRSLQEFTPPTEV